MALAVLCAAGVLVGLAGGTSSAGASSAGASSAGAGGQVPSYYLALGGSGSVGFQPTVAHPEGQRTDRGYANDLLLAERSRWSALSLVQLGCPGATTQTMLAGGGNCAYAEGSQLGAAVSFLHDHPSTVLVTLDIGFNDVERCLRPETIDQYCATAAIERVRDQLPLILDRLRAAGRPGLEIVGVGHYDPFLGYYVDGSAGPPFASASLGVMMRLNDALRAAYAAAGVPMADVAAAFDLTSTQVTQAPGLGAVPRNVAQACALTWVCVPSPLGPNRHPNDAGYRVIAGAIAAVIAAH
jgi:lysophospholipase L1-like esterase